MTAILPALALTGLLLALPATAQTALTGTPQTSGSTTTAPAATPGPLQGLDPAVLEAAGLRPAGTTSRATNVAPVVQQQAPGPLPADPARAARPLVFGSQMFSGRFASEAFSGFNPDYQLAVGDRVHLRMWGAFNHEGTQVVDAQGNLFVPSLGPVRVLGVRNGELNERVEAQVKRTFRANVGVYATLEAAQPVKIYVTGFVKAPGLYPGLSSDSVLYYLDRAGGIDPDRGSYLGVDLLRGGKSKARINLYDFLLNGQITPMQLQDGDTIVVPPRRHTVQVIGEVLNPYIFELDSARTGADMLLAMARPRPAATHLSITRRTGPQRRSEYHPIADAAKIQIEDGDEVTVTADKYPGTILVRVEGANLSERTLVLPYGARLKDALDRLRPAPQANVNGLQLFRQSVAERQKALMETALRNLETYALTARSATSEESALRQREGQQILEFVQRARLIQPRGQVILAQAGGAGDTLLEDGDTLRIPEASNLVMVSGEVLFPNALVFDPQADLEAYVRQAGGYTQGADEAKVVVLRQDGSVVADARSTKLQAGDEILVLPRIQSKNVEIARGITQIVYQIAVAARIALGL
ncbi:polysaccharide biosynthesis/export family protein [Rubrivivax sp. RP6-9]|uniref:polysaccharide biosynthesis/export family protein n=1 Tax=Rubrivivax sp. RP6-9 TaxID=3415750 RepID=UPI003CC610DC